MNIVLVVFYQYEKAQKHNKLSIRNISIPPFLTALSLTEIKVKIFVNIII